jgi:hypothetical protein
MAITSEKIKLVKVRLSFPVLYTPKSFAPGQDPKYQATFLLDPSDAEHAKAIKEIKKQAKKIAMEAFGEVPKGLKKCFGLAKDHDKKSEYDGYQGMFYISTANTSPPVLADQHKKPLDQADGKFYAGAFVTTVVTLWTQDHPVGGKGINANLRIVQFVKDGEAFGGNAPANIDDELDEVDSDDSDADDDWDDDDI